MLLAPSIPLLVVGWRSLDVVRRKMHKGGIAMNPESCTYAKSRSCPSTYSVMSLLNKGLSAEEEAGILWHLRACDFCGAEAELLSRHPVEIEETTSPLIPEPLRLLAESLLGRRFDPGPDLVADLRARRYVS